MVGPFWWKLIEGDPWGPFDRARSGRDCGSARVRERRDAAGVVGGLDLAVRAGGVLASRSGVLEGLAAIGDELQEVLGGVRGDGVDVAQLVALELLDAELPDHLRGCPAGGRVHIGDRDHLAVVGAGDLVAVLLDHEA